MHWGAGRVRDPRWAAHTDAATRQLGPPASYPDSGAAGARHMERQQ